MKPFLERINEGRTLVADGAMGTMLFELGWEPGTCPESMNLEQTSCLEEIAQRYQGAGAEVIQTNTFGGSPLKLASYGLEHVTNEINRNAVLAVRRAIRGAAYVSGSCGPTGRMLKPHGDTDPADIHSSFVRQIDSLVEAGVDIICVETMTDLTEATLAVRAAKEVSPTIPVMATMTFDSTPRGFFTIMGVTIQQAVDGLTKAGADVIGSNCGNGIENMIEIARAFRECTDRPLVIQSNAGLPETRGPSTVYGETPAFMADKARELVTMGVAVIGGCCGTTPDHVRAIAAMVDSLSEGRV